MKSLKILSTLFVFATLSIVACNKDALTTDATDNSELAVNDFDDAAYEYEHDIDLQPELEDRAASLTTVTQKVANKVGSTDACRKDSHVDMEIIPSNALSTWTITGTELSATQNITALKGTATANGYVKAIAYQSTPAFNKAKTDTVNCTIVSWSATSIEATLPASAVNFDSLRTFYVRFIVGVPTQAKDSSIVSVKEKKKSVKCIGSFLSARYGNNMDWDLYMLLKHGNAVGLPTTGGYTAVAGAALTAAPTYGTLTTMPTDSANVYVPQVGDEVQNADGSRRGFVYAIGTKDPTKGRTKVRIYERICNTSSLKKGTWTLQQAGTYGTKSYTANAFVKTNDTNVFTKYKRKQ